MMTRKLRLFFGAGMLAAITLIAGGCNQQQDKGTQVAEGNKANASDDGKQDNGKDDKGGEDGHNLHGYWCAGHGVPEEMCSLCSADKAAEFKAKGDWCEVHDRAKSQCFKCDPKLYDRFAAMYKAKFGEDPPRPPESEFEK